MMQYDAFYYSVFATHCITLHHTASHCNTLQHTATLCNTLQRTARSHVTRPSLVHVRHSSSTYARHELRLIPTWHGTYECVVARRVEECHRCHRSSIGHARQVIHDELTSCILWIHYSRICNVIINTTYVNVKN